MTAPTPDPKGPPVNSNPHDRRRTPPDVLALAVEIPDVLAAVSAAVQGAAPGPVPLPSLEAARSLGGHTWVWASPEARAAVLLTLALSSRDATPGDARAVTDALEGLADGHPMASLSALTLARDLHAQARTHRMTDPAAGTREWFGARFPALPYPGVWGRLASSAAFDEDDEADLGAALLLAALIHRADTAGGAS